MSAPAKSWRFSPDPTIERIWRVREELERAAGGDVRKLFELATAAAARARAEVSLSRSSRPAKK